jgi:methylphosphotriester-DNA--protein-cysteine methyltransferase
MIRHIEISDRDLRSEIKQQKIRFAGNSRLRIYGTLSCAAGKRMKRENRTFFMSEEEAIASGFRPCGNCLKATYQRWKDEAIRRHR